MLFLHFTHFDVGYHDTYRLDAFTAPTILLPKIITKKVPFWSLVDLVLVRPRYQTKFTLRQAPGGKSRPPPQAREGVQIEIGGRPPGVKITVYR